MCYDIKFLTQKKLNYAKRMGESPDEIKRIENDLNILTQNVLPQFHVSAYTHPNILCFINEENNMKPYLLRWGLIPHWIKNETDASQIQNKTINARIETIAIKPSFKSSVKNRRCIILLDGFYEHYHYKGKSYPFYIFHKENKPLIVGGLWENWTMSDKNILSTTTIITTRGKGIMNTIHNNPKLKEPRMPFLLSKDQIENWLSEKTEFSPEIFSNNNEHDKLNAYTIKPLRGKNYIGNLSEVCTHYKYPDLNIQRLNS